MYLFMSHYDNQTGTAKAFKFPSKWVEQVWKGWDKKSGDELRLAMNGKWRYAAPPRFTHGNKGYGTIEVALINVPGEDFGFPGCDDGGSGEGSSGAPVPGNPGSGGGGPSGGGGNGTTPGGGGGSSGGGGGGSSGGGPGGNPSNPPPPGPGGGIPINPPTPNDPDYPGRPTPEEMGCPSDYFVRPICRSVFTDNAAGGTVTRYSIGEPILMPTEECYACTGGVIVPCSISNRKKAYMPNHVDLNQVSACNLLPIKFHWTDCVCFSSNCIGFPTWVSGEVVGWTCCETEEMWDPSFESSWGGYSNDRNCNPDRAKKTYKRPNDVMIRWVEGFDFEAAATQQEAQLKAKPELRATTTKERFPDYKPSTRAIKYGEWNTKRYTAGPSAQQMVMPLSVKRAQKSNVILELTYANHPDQLARDFMRHYLNHRGTFHDFKLPKEKLEEGPMAGWRVADGDRYLSKGDWTYLEAPTITSQHPGTSSVTLRLVCDDPTAGPCDLGSGGGSGGGGPAGPTPTPSPGPGPPAPPPQPTPPGDYPVPDPPGTEGQNKTYRIYYQRVLYSADYRNCSDGSIINPGIGWKTNDEEDIGLRAMSLTLTFQEGNIVYSCGSGESTSDVIWSLSATTDTGTFGIVQDFRILNYTNGTSYHDEDQPRGVRVNRITINGTEQPLPFT